MDQYFKEGNNGGVVFDLEGALVDLLTIVKAAGYTSSMIHSLVDEVWDNLEVSVVVPKESSN